MTIAELSQFYHITREIADLRRRIRELELKAQPGAARMSGMPGGGGVADPTGDLAAELAEARARLSDELRQRRSERARLEWYIRGVPDAYIRRIMRFRYVDGLSWQAVAFRMGGRNTASGVRMAVFRYVEKEENNDNK